jgi:hypothetical protein
MLGHLVPQGTGCFDLLLDHRMLADAHEMVQSLPLHHGDFINSEIASASARNVLGQAAHLSPIHDFRDATFNQPIQFSPGPMSPGQCSLISRFFSFLFSAVVPILTFRLLQAMNPITLSQIHSLRQLLQVTPLGQHRRTINRLLRPTLPAIILRRPRTAHRLQRTAHRLQRTAHRRQRTAHRLLHTAHRLQRTAHRRQRTAHRLLHTALRRQRTALHLQLTALHLQLTALHLQLTALHLQLTALRRQLTALHLQLTALHLQLTAPPHPRIALRLQLTVRLRQRTVLQIRLQLRRLERRLRIRLRRPLTAPPHLARDDVQTHSCMCVSVARNFQHSARCNLFLHFTINAPKNNP